MSNQSTKSQYPEHDAVTTSYDRTMRHGRLRQESVLRTGHPPRHAWATIALAAMVVFWYSRYPYRLYALACTPSLP
ncbi:hypothetical protein FA95DRAFT_1565042 [Auriscalpium vulgare]|uniref:Uncharacterized protein n=1 Tax=Auriscalpium vulgare TaxID=40419 RepID=A0ACB8RCF5_9AGAM|nr:hypothetical protein FA95DRAFT_1565042 [Auriscalpium vulgare]